MFMVPKCIGSSSFYWWKWLTRKPSVAVELLQKIFGTRNGSFSNGEISTRYDALKPLSFRYKREIFLGLLRKPKKTGYCVLEDFAIDQDGNAEEKVIRTHRSNIGETSDSAMTI